MEQTQNRHNALKLNSPPPTALPVANSCNIISTLPDPNLIMQCGSHTVKQHALMDNTQDGINSAWDPPDAGIAVKENSLQSDSATVKNKNRSESKAGKHVQSILPPLHKFSIPRSPEQIMQSQLVLLSKRVLNEQRLIVNEPWIKIYSMSDSGIEGFPLRLGICGLPFTPLDNYTFILHISFALEPKMFPFSPPMITCENGSEFPFLTITNVIDNVVGHWKMDKSVVMVLSALRIDLSSKSKIFILEISLIRKNNATEPENNTTQTAISHAHSLEEPHSLPQSQSQSLDQIQTQVPFQQYPEQLQQIQPQTPFQPLPQSLPQLQPPHSPSYSPQSLEPTQAQPLPQSMLPQLHPLPQNLEQIHAQQLTQDIPLQQICQPSILYPQQTQPQTQLPHYSPLPQSLEPMQARPLPQSMLPQLQPLPHNLGQLHAQPLQQICQPQILYPQQPQPQFYQLPNLLPPLQPLLLPQLQPFLPLLLYLQLQAQYFPQYY